MGHNVLSNDFTWSKSRHEKFSDCRRAYYLHYYGSWGGWENGASDEARQLFTLKRLANRFNWAGNVVHAQIRDVLRTIQAGRPVDAEAVIHRAHQVMRRDWAYSRSKSYWDEGKRRPEFTGLVEHEYDEPIPAEEWRRNWETVEQGLRWFLASAWIDRARSLPPEAWLEVDEGAQKSNFDMEGIKVFAIPDFVFRDASGQITVVDWKTGKMREGYADQVVGYALYLAHRYRVAPESVRCLLVFVNEGEEVEIRIDAATVQRFRAHFEESVRAMQALLVNAASNVPVDSSQFPKTEDLLQCARCAFRRACGREGVTFASLAAGAAQAA
ncbi:MAG TPA: PD-(D/E)XK nuclease family protein [Myxococcaceae bacterium]|nr:PD-(D/E)XK nuclease family protein [Myxococcaceae bacterium]